MRSVCLYFQVHQPYRLRTYRFFNIGNDHYYYDDYQNRHIIRRVAEKCYLPANRMMLQLINEFGKAFKVSYSISGTALDQFTQYVPEVIQSFRQLAATGCVEFISETEYHSLASLGSEKEFVRQVESHNKRVEELFGQKPQTFRNSELIYSDSIGETIANLGFHTMLTEGAKHILGWKSPNYIYCNNLNPKLRVLLRNFRLSDDVSFRFSEQKWSEWPLTAEKFVGWLNTMDPHEEVVNLFMDYETIGEHQWKETGIFDFFYHLPSALFSKSNFNFATPEELYQRLQPMGALSVPYAISWADEERDLTAWKGNELQTEAFSKLYSLSDAIEKCQDPVILRDWGYLQSSNHFYYMSTKWFSAGEVHKHFNPYGSPYDAFINYMNAVSDFTIRVEAALASSDAVKKEKKPARKTVKKSSAVKPKATRKAIKSASADVKKSVKKDVKVKAVKASKKVVAEPVKAKAGIKAKVVKESKKGQAKAEKPAKPKQAGKTKKVSKPRSAEQN
ncbi:MAG: alpha-amylase [Bacteroidetes bacterium]|nr:alpha-amylase [Bacteroidota bacterium]